jgi:DnaJ-class molecular chaperone
MICPKCNGKGYLPEYIHQLNDGRCWKCSGTGTIENNPTKQESKIIKPKRNNEKFRKERQLKNYEEMLQVYKDRKNLIPYDEIEKLVKQLKQELEAL